MSNETDWFTSAAGRRVTVTEIAEYLDISRRTATNRVQEGLTADDIIRICRSLSIQPVAALVELGKLEFDEVLGFMESDGTLLANASSEQLVFQLAAESLPVSLLIDLGNRGRDRVSAMERRSKVAETENAAPLQHPEPGADHGATEPPLESDFEA